MFDKLGSFSRIATSAARYCHVNRLLSTRGAVCRAGERAVVYCAGPHHGEEDCLRGWGGSGTVFFSWCNLRCVFCQNWEIARRRGLQRLDSGSFLQ